MLEKAGIAVAARLPDRPMPGRDRDDMTEVRLERMQAGTVAFADEAGEGLSALMGVQMPGFALVVRQADERPTGQLLHRT